MAYITAHLPIEKTKKIARATVLHAVAIALLPFVVLLTVLLFPFVLLSRGKVKSDYE